MPKKISNSELESELRIIDIAVARILSDEERDKRDLDRRIADDHAAIESFLGAIENAQATGEWREVRYNIFDVLGRPRLEEAHTRLVAWLLDPCAAHGLHDGFLRQFMLRAIGNEPPSTVGVTVKFEKEFDGGRRFDIYVEGPGWCMVVENKIDDQPWEDQRKRLKSYCDRQRKAGSTAWLVYLTRDSRCVKQPTHCISYYTVGNILNTLEPDVGADLVIRHFGEHILSDLGV